MPGGVMGEEATTGGPDQQEIPEGSTVVKVSWVELEVPSPALLWDTASLTFAAVLYTAGITVLGVLVAPPRWEIRLGYAVLCVVALILILTKLKAVMIKASKRIIGRLAD